MVRKMEQWASEVIAFLSTHQPPRKKVDAYDYDVQLNIIVTELSNVTPQSLPRVLGLLFHFATFWKIPLERVMPTQEEVADWFRD